MEKVLKYIRNFVEISDDDFAVIAQKFSTKSFNANETVSVQGEVVSHYYFVNSGCLKIASEDFETDKVHSCWFARVGEFFTELASLRTKTPSKYAITAVEDSEVLSISNEDMELLYAEIPRWQEFGRRMWEEAFIRIEKRVFSFQTQSAEERYITNLESGLTQQIPLKDLSSFIGVTPNSLSRIRKNIR